MPGKYYVYVHRRESDGSIFYVGKGCGKREYDKKGRNQHWQRVFSKHGMRSERIFNNLSHFCALSIEMALISHIGLKNLTNSKSGDLSGYEFSDEVRLKMSRAKKGWVPPPRTIQTREKLSRLNSIEIVSDRGEVFRNGIEAEQFLRANGYPTASRGNISSVINGKLDRCYDRTWARLSDGIPDYQPYVSVKRKAVIRSDGVVFSSATHAAKSVNGSQGNISMCCRGERGLAYGFKWSYA